MIMNQKEAKLYFDFKKMFNDDEDAGYGYPILIEKLKELNLEEVKFLDQAFPDMNVCRTYKQLKDV